VLDRLTYGSLLGLRRDRKYEQQEFPRAALVDLTISLSDKFKLSVGVGVKDNVSVLLTLVKEFLTTLGSPRSGSPCWVINVCRPLLAIVSMDR